MQTFLPKSGNYLLDRLGEKFAFVSTYFLLIGVSLDSLTTLFPPYFDFAKRVTHRPVQRRYIIFHLTEYGFFDGPLYDSSN